MPVENKNYGTQFDEKTGQVTAVITKHQNEADKIDATDRKSAEIHFGDPGIYSAVLAASFGKVNIELDPKSKAQVHPFFLLLLSIPAFVVQIGLLLFLRTDIPTKVHEEDHDKVEMRYRVQPEHPANEKVDMDSSLLRLKLIMIFVFYIMNFMTILRVLDHLCFLLNPLTWVEVWSEDADKKKKDAENEGHSSVGTCWKNFALLITPSCAIAAMAMSFTVNYIVCTDTVSVILSSEDAQTVIFDTLAITFIVEISARWWGVCETAFHFSSLDSINLECFPDQHTWDENNKLRESKKKELFCPSFVEFAIRWTTFSDKSSSFLRIGHGARRLKEVLEVMLLVFIYQRQFFIVLRALDTNILPVIRDLCRWEKTWQYFSETILAATLSESLGVVNNETSVALKEIRKEGKVHCSEILEGEDNPFEAFFVKTQIWQNHKYAMIGYLVVMILFIVPKILGFVWRRYKSLEKAQDPSSNGDKYLQVQQSEDMQTPKDPLQAEFNRLSREIHKRDGLIKVQEERINTLKKEMKKLNVLLQGLKKD